MYPLLSANWALLEPVVAQEPEMGAKSLQKEAIARLSKAIVFSQTKCPRVACTSRNGSA